MFWSLWLVPILRMTTAKVIHRYIFFKNAVKKSAAYLNLSEGNVTHPVKPSRPYYERPLMTVICPVLQAVQPIMLWMVRRGAIVLVCFIHVRSISVTCCLECQLFITLLNCPLFLSYSDGPIGRWGHVSFLSYEQNFGVFINNLARSQSASDFVYGFRDLFWAIKLYLRQSPCRRRVIASSVICLL